MPEEMDGPVNGLAVGQRVQWTSQARGHRTRKTGTVAAVVPEKTDVLRCYAWLLHEIDEEGGKRPRRMFSGGLPRKQLSYIVLTDSGPRGGAPRAYWPWPHQLKPVSP